MNNSDYMALSIAYATKKIFRYDAELFHVNVHEVAINHRLAMYLEEQIRPQPINNINNLVADLEYNRILNNGNMSDCTQLLLEYTDFEGNIHHEWKNVRPDIIIHERSSNINDILWLEVKTGTDPDVCKEDLIKAYYACEQLYFMYGGALLLDFINKRCWLMLMQGNFAIEYYYSMEDEAPVLYSKMEHNGFRPEPIRERIIIMR